MVTIERQQEVICVLSRGDISSDLDGPLPGFQGHGIFEVKYLKYRAFYGLSFYRKLIGNYTKSIEWYQFQ